MKTALFCLIIFFISGCVSSLSNSKKTESIYAQYIKSNELEKSNRITAFRFHGWNSLDRENLIISTNFKKPYLVTLRAPCYGLPFAHSIGVDNEGSSLDAGFDSIVVPDSLEAKCMIDGIYKITVERAEEIRQLKNKK